MSGPGDDFFELSWIARIWLRMQVVAIAFVTRTADLALLLFRPRLLAAYLALFWAELTHSPYRVRRDFESVRRIRAAGQSADELVYGELALFAAASLFRSAGVRRGSRVLDVGAGRGRALLGARFLGAGALGLELCPEHVVPVKDPLARVGAELRLEDALTADWSFADGRSALGMAHEEGGSASTAPRSAQVKGSGADETGRDHGLPPTHVYLNWCALADDTRARVVDRVLTLPSGTRVLAVKVPADHPRLKLIGERRALFTWGRERVFLYELASPES